MTAWPSAKRLRHCPPENLSHPNTRLAEKSCSARASWGSVVGQSATWAANGRSCTRCGRSRMTALGHQKWRIQPFGPSVVLEIIHDVPYSRRVFSTASWAALPPTLNRKRTPCSLLSLPACAAGSERHCSLQPIGVQYHPPNSVVLISDLHFPGLTVA